MHIESDGSSAKKIRGAACVFMGLSHLLYLKEYLKGALYALVELVFIALLPNVIIKKLVGLITLGSPQPDVAVKNRDNSIFMLIDGILVLAIIAIFKYRDLKTQIRLTNVLMLLIVTLIIVIAVMMWVLHDKLIMQFTPYIVMPFVALILVWLAKKGIKHDKKLLADSERIR